MPMLDLPPSKDPGQRHERFVVLTAELGLLDSEISDLLGCLRSSWSMYRSGAIPVPRYIVAALEALAALQRHAPKVFNSTLNDFQKRR